jgi:hypothetical protein
MFEDKQFNRSPGPSRSDELANLTHIPVTALRRALAHDLDSPDPLLVSVEDSQIAIAQAIQLEMEAQCLTIYHPHEVTGLSCDFIEAMANGDGDLSDSAPLTTLQEALHTKLTHL